MQRIQRHFQRGFTLLEMLVVITLIGIVAGLALPNFSRMLDSFGAASQWREVEAQLGALPMRALQSGRTLVLSTDSARELLPGIGDSWRVEVGTPVRYQASGWCEGGVVRVVAADGTAREYRLSAPRCTIGGETT